jgi:hypothetical protein
MSFVISQSEVQTFGLESELFEGERVSIAKRGLITAISNMTIKYGCLYDMGFDLIRRIESADGNSIIVFTFRKYGNPLFTENSTG